MSHGVLFAALTWWSWRKWPDPLVDFGRELYVPWQITQGAVLHRDILTLFGPLSPYVNACWMTLFGVSLTTLAVANLVTLALIAACVHLLVRRATDATTATASSLVLLTMFGFSQYVETGNYNFVTPYSHEATHGIALGVACLLVFHAAIAERRWPLGSIAGLSAGMLLLTKPETCLAAFAAIGIGAAAAATGDDQERRDLAKTISATVLCAAVPPAIFFAFFSRYMSVKPALLAVGSAWTSVADAGITQLPFYLRVSGFDHPLSNLASMIGIFLAAAGIVAAAIAAFTIGGRRPPGWVPWLRVALVVLLPLVVWAFPWGRALPLSTLAALCASVAGFVAFRYDRVRAMRFLLLLMWCAYGLVLLAKIGLNAHVYHYGFYLALPATVATVVVISWMVPSTLHVLGFTDGARRFRFFALWAILASVGVFLAMSNERYRSKTVAVGTGSDLFYGPVSPDEWQATAVSEALGALQQIAGADDRIAVIPEGVMFNYLARRRTPLRVTNLMPPEWLVFGEGEVLSTLQADPPDFVVYVHRSTWEYGYPLFGSEARYGAATTAWVDAHYDQIRVFGQDPRSPSGRGLQILRYRDRSVRSSRAASQLPWFTPENSNSAQN